MKDNTLYEQWTHLNLASFLWDISHQCATRSDAAICGVWSDSALFAYRMYFYDLNEVENYNPQPQIRNGLVQLIGVNFG